MKLKNKGINFGSIEHFLFVRINCLCTDLGYSFKEFIEQAYCFLVELIDEDGITHFEILKQQYKDYSAYRAKTRYAPRMIEKKHLFNVANIHEEVHEHLSQIKKENRFSWIDILVALYMVVEVELDKMDERAWRDGEIRKFVIEEFLERRTAYLAQSQRSKLNFEDESYQIKKSTERRAWEAEANVYPQKFEEERE